MLGTNEPKSTCHEEYIKQQFGHRKQHKMSRKTFPILARYDFTHIVKRKHAH